MDKNKQPNNQFFHSAPDSFQEFMDLDSGSITESSLDHSDIVTPGVVNNLSIDQLRDKYDGVIPTYILVDWLANKLPIEPPEFLE